MSRVIGAECLGSYFRHHFCFRSSPAMLGALVAIGIAPCDDTAERPDRLSHGDDPRAAAAVAGRARCRRQGLAGVKLGDRRQQHHRQVPEAGPMSWWRRRPAGGDLKAGRGDSPRPGKADHRGPDRRPRLLSSPTLPEMKDAVIFNIRAEDDRLRTADCRANVFHHPEPRHEGGRPGAVSWSASNGCAGCWSTASTTRTTGLCRRDPAHRQALSRRDRRGARL